MAVKVPQQYVGIIETAAVKYGVPISLLESQIAHESNFNATARSKPNNDQWHSVDRGIAQINNHWHPEVTDAQADDPNFAINWMANNMASKYKQYGDWGAALSAYNTGNPNDGFYNGYVKAIVDKAGQFAQQNVVQPLQQILNPQQNTQTTTTQQALAGNQAMSGFQPMQLPTTNTNPAPPKVDLASILNSIGQNVSNANQQNPSVIGNLATGQSWNQGIGMFGGGLTKPISDQQFQDNNNPAYQQYQQQNWQADQMPANSTVQAMNQNSPFAGKVPTPNAAAMQSALSNLPNSNQGRQY